MTRSAADARATTLPAKQPATVVAGPYGHPFHPILVTIPIGAWVSSLVLDIGSHVVSHPAGLMRGAYWLIAIGVIGGPVRAVGPANHPPRHPSLQSRPCTHDA